MPPSGAHFSELPDELVESILALLPLRQVARARLVCRQWNTLTRAHHFVRASFLRRQAGHGHPITGFFFNHRLLSASDYFPLDREADEEAAAQAAGDRLAPDISFIPGTFCADEGRGGMRIRDSCGGLLLLCSWPPPDRRSIHYVCNPLTKKLVPIVLPIDSEFCVNLAFDPSEPQHYKVIALDYKRHVHVYSSKTQSWHMSIHAVSLLHGLCPTRGVFCNGSVVWIVAHSLVRFIIEEEHVTKMPMPSKEKDWICAYIGESGGHLQLIGYTKKDKLTACFKILEMQQNKSEWSVLYRIDLSRVKELYPDIELPTWNTRERQHKIIDYLALSPIYVIRGTRETGQHGVLVFSIPGRIMSYNIENQEISMVKEISGPNPLEQFWYNFYAYNPSLFAL
ncbi:hypothetical protein EJB05_30752, partial [Eragrostis curvula]